MEGSWEGIAGCVVHVDVYGEGVDAMYSIPFQLCLPETLYRSSLL